MRHTKYLLIKGAVTLKRQIALITLLATMVSGAVAKVINNDSISDGPYVFYNNGVNEVTAKWVCDGEVTTQQKINPGLKVERCGLPAFLGQLAFSEQLVQYNDGKKIAALSDMHGQFELTVNLLRNNGIIDDNNNWIFGDGHFVITGDVFDRGDKQTELLWLLFKLEQQAQKRGGKVHLLLGNHEVMILNGDLRYLNPKYTKTAELLQRPFEQLYGKETVLGKWLRSRAVLAKINGYLFAHGGFHPELAEHKFTLQDINQLFKSNLVKSELDTPRQGWGESLHKTNGPIWYRGYFKDGGATEQELDALLSHFDVKRIVVGHTSQKKIETRYDGKVVAIDSSLKRGKYGEVLFITDDKLTRGTLDGEKIPLPDVN